jgi:membrane-associated protein
VTSPTPVERVPQGFTLVVPGIHAATVAGAQTRPHAGPMDLIALAATPVLAYLLVVGIVALDATFPAIPSDAAVVSAGALAAAGHLSLGWAVAAVVAGAMAGDHLVYALARHKLPGILERSRLGRRIRRNADRAYGRMEGVSTVALAMGRFIPFGRTAASATAGLVGVPALRYLWISLLGAGTWAAWMVGLGFFTGHLTGGPLWIQVLLAVSVGFVVAAGLAFLQRAVARRKVEARGRNSDQCGFDQVDASPELVSSHG